MKKNIALLILILFFFTPKLSAQDVGTAAAVSTQTASSNSWQSWVFGISALIAATIGVVVVALNPGSNSH